MPDKRPAQILTLSTYKSLQHVPNISYSDSLSFQLMHLHYTNQAAVLRQQG